MDLTPQFYETVMNLTRSDSDEVRLEQVLHQFLDNPFINRVQIFSNQAVRILDNSRLKYLYVSSSIFELTGFTKEEIVNGGLWFTYRQVHPLDMLKFARIVLKVKNVWRKLSAEEKLSARFSFDIRARCKDGGYKHFLQSCHALSISPKGKPYVLLFTSTDITTYKKSDSMSYSFQVARDGQFVTLLAGNMHPDDMPLSSRELEVLRLTSLGHSEKIISEMMFLSVETVKTHRRNMLQKTEAKNSIELVRMGIANGWI